MTPVEPVTPSPNIPPASASREAAGTFARAFHASPALMAIARVADGRIIEVNEAFYAGAGYTREEVIGRTSIELNIWPNPADRVAFMARLKEKGLVRNYEAVFHTKQQGPRFVSLNADIFELNGEACMLMTAIDLTDRRRREQVQEATFQISRVLLAGGDLSALFAELHRIIAGLLPARNFYVAVPGPGDGLIHFPYFVDQFIPSVPSRPPGNGLTDYVLETGRALRVTQAELAALLGPRGPYQTFEHPALVRLVAPLLIEGRAIGVIAVQDYANPAAYTEEDQRLLTFVADQAAAAVHRRMSEARERESQEFFAKSFQTTPALMIIARLADGHILEANAGFEQASGYTRAEALGHSTLALGLWIDPAERDRFVGLMRREGRVRDFEGVFRNRHGAIRPFLLNADVFEMHGTKCMLTIGVDITERRRQQRVQDATYHVAQAVLAGGDLTTLFAELHRIVAGLLPARNLYVALLSPDGSLLSFPYFVDETVLTPPPTRKPGFGLTEYVLHTGRPLLTTADELTVLLRDHREYVPVGKPAALWLGVPLIIAGRAIGVIAVQDYANPAAYTEEDKRLLTFVASQAAAAVQRRQAEEALQRAERQYREMFENALEGLYQTTPDGRFLRANAAMARLLGYTSPAALVATVNDVGRQLYVEPGRRAQFLELIRLSDSVPDFESEVVRADGSRLRMSESVRAVRNAAGEISHFEGVAIDVTATHERARALREARDAADAANRAKSHFLASMSHELRTPLNGILGYTQILRRDPVLTAKQRDGVAIIHQSADHLLALINDVLDLAKIEAHKLELHPAEFDLPEFVRAVEGVFQPRARDKGLLLETAFAADLPPVVVGDAQRLRQIVFNLLSNSVKFTRQGGVIFSVERAGDRIRFSVSDSGPGIAPEERPRLFEPFAQIGDHRLHAEGTGLGLNISRGLVEQMGGVLQVESRAGWGSRFWFEVPLPVATGAAVKPAAPARRIIGYAGRRRTILVADDNPNNARLMLDILEPLGFTVITAADGLEAVARAKEERPDLALLDLRMPRLDGFGAARAIAAAWPKDPPKMIGISASAFEPDRAACLEAGCGEFLAKPFREEELLNVFERQLGLKWLLAEPATRETVAPFPVVQHAPAPADAEALFDLACKGDVVGVRTYAQKLAERDARLAPFAQGVVELAARFKMKAIRQFVDRYRGGKKTEGPKG
ncbi:MAG: PAS domain S-box protein [Lacunisphaera sp.]|nr:PAS domain S-box protein [Lacunisphaera sp.]